jgi:hypothetical protein
MGLRDNDGCGLQLRRGIEAVKVGSKGRAVRAGGNEGLQALRREFWKLRTSILRTGDKC